jgi:Protein of unknown function (DUF3108)
MRRLTRFLLAAAVSLPAWPPAAGAVKVPARIEITYRMLLGTLRIGEGHDVFEHDAKTYKLTSESQTAGLAEKLFHLNITRVATGTVTALGLRPGTYEETRNGQLKRRVRFDWNHKKVELFDGQNTHTADLPDNTWDMASFGYNFAFTPSTSERMDLFLTDGRRVSPYEYTLLGHERIETELGSLDTLHVKKVQRADDPRAFDVWLAPDRHYAPVRILITVENGAVFDSVVTRISFSDR